MLPISEDLWDPMSTVAVLTKLGEVWLRVLPSLPPPPLTRGTYLAAEQ